MTKICSQCGVAQPLADYARARKNKDGLVGKCRACVAAYSAAHHQRNRERKNAQTAAWKEKNRERSLFLIWRSHLFRQYGLSIEEYDQLLLSQNGACAICHEVGDPRKLCVDHEHVVGYAALTPENKRRYVRSLLCRQCNALLGMARESPDLLSAAAAYLAKHRKDQ